MRHATTPMTRRPPLDREAVKKGRFTYTWPRAGGWGAGSDPVITCYVKTR
ncbi:hypothetical protein ACFPN0_00015 [Kitasatospora cinereorecta]